MILPFVVSAAFESLALLRPVAVGGDRRVSGSGIAPALTHKKTRQRGRVSILPQLISGKRERSIAGST
jgi:hypothetical protein